jgi:D-3-phosphoglycerate dehydrogenase
MTLRILVADKLAPSVPGMLQDLGAELEIDPSLSEGALTERLGEHDPHVLVVRSTKVNEAHLSAAPSLSLVVRAGAGVNTIDLDAASGRGIYVANCPGKNAAAVAELALGHLLNLDRRIADHVATIREGRWDKKGLGAGHGLRGRTLAVLGTGSIGREVITRAQSFGMQVVAWSRSLTREQADALGVEWASTPEEAARSADAVSVHLALAPDTRGRIGRSVFEAMRQGAYFINTARAEVVDSDALLAAVRDKGIRAGLDVFDGEPSGGKGELTDPLGSEREVYGTCHVGASTAEAEEAVGDEVTRIISAYRDGQTIPNCVNLADQSPATHVLVVRHADRVGVLAGVLDVLRQADHNVQEMQNIVFRGGDAACARIAVVGEPSTETRTRLGEAKDVFSVNVAPV